MIPPELLNTITTGDARELAKRIPDESVDLVFCDPVYWNHDDYAWLAELGARVLKQGGNLIAQCGNPDLPVLLDKMRPHLRYNRILAEKFPVATQAYYEARCFVGWKPYLWFTKGERIGKWVFDAMVGGGSLKRLHQWQDSPKVFIAWIERLSASDAVVLDPFCGSGTVPAVCKMLGRQYVAFEIDPDTAERARLRVQQTQPPLPGLEFEQASMDIPA